MRIALRHSVHFPYFAVYLSEVLSILWGIQIIGQKVFRTVVSKNTHNKCTDRQEKTLKASDVTQKHQRVVDFSVDLSYI